jgi:hypothetical protein
MVSVGELDRIAIALPTIISTRNGFVPADDVDETAIHGTPGHSSVLIETNGGGVVVRRNQP